MTDETDSYDPSEPTPPAREPPRRETAPQSEFTRRQAGIGLLVVVTVLAVLVGLVVGLA